MLSKVVIVLLMMAGCVATKETPDASTPVGLDAASCPPPPRTLPTCGEIDTGCATGTIPLECPHSEDTSVCWCPGKAPGAPHGWCFTP